MLKKLFGNTRKPEGFLGRVILHSMNSGHAKLAEWALSHVTLSPDAHVLDIGCGGGANIARFLKLCLRGKVDGIDYSDESVAASCKLNRNALGKRCDIRQGDAGDLPYGDASFDFVSAFETVYFWPDIAKAFDEVRRVLKIGGRFLIVCEGSRPEANAKWTEMIGGMTVRTGEELQSLMECAGFSDVTLNKGKGEWIMLIGEKR